MSSTTAKSALRQGFLAGAPFIVMAIPFAMLFGVIATEAGLSIAQAMGFSFVVIAGASQFTAVTLMEDSAPVWLVLLAALAVNLRMAMYSASLQPYLGDAPLWKRALAAYMNLDQSYAVSIQKFEANPGMTTPECYAYFFGSCIPLVPLWFLFTWVGALVGARIPDWLPLDYAMPILFLALVAPMIRTRAHLAAALTSAIFALAFASLPSGLGLILAAILAMMVGAEIERRSS